MCGIAGIVDLHVAPTDVEIEAMIAVIPYRGPDGSGRLCLQGVALGHRRLSILDLSEAGSQPMASADGRYQMIYNGEVYNYLEVRRELEQLGHTFRSHSDTEVLLYAYQEWGAECVSRFMGMYAFAIWDCERRELFAARDRLGIKPFYYHEHAGRMLFASEIKSILAVRRDRAEVDASLIDAYMEFGYVPGSETLHKGVRRLPPGHTLVWRDGRVSTKRYWDLDFTTAPHDSLEASAAEMRRMLQESITLHLRSDVPLGVFLSGGLDSSAVVALLSRGASQGLKTFSVAYDFGPEYDETPYAREIAAAFSTDHHETRVTPREFVDFVPDFIWHMDEPVTEAAGISLYYVSKLAREHVVVCLSGEGSDELFAGYDFYSYNLAIERARRLFGGRPFQALSSLARASSGLAKAQKYLALAAQPLDKRYRGISSYETAKKQRLYTPGFAAAAARGNDQCAGFLSRLFERSKGWDDLSRMLYFDTNTWLVDDLLIKADRMSMATSVELRVPFLDHRLVERAAGLPSTYKIRRGDTKHILKVALQDALPQRILRRRKMGFPTPLQVMLRDSLFQYARDTLSTRAAQERGYFQRSEVESLLSDHRSGKRANHREIWQLLVLEEWHRRFSY